MSHDGWTSVLVLGGIRSGKSAYAELLAAASPQVRYLATAAAAQDDGFAKRIEEHRRRRPTRWRTVEVGADPDLLPAELVTAAADETLLVDDLGGWAQHLLGRDDAAERCAALAEAIGRCPARVIVVSGEVGMALVPTTPVGADYVDLLGRLNQLVAAECDQVVLVVAGQATTVKTTDGTARATTVRGSATVPATSSAAVPAGAAATISETVSEPTGETGPEPVRTSPATEPPAPQPVTAPTEAVSSNTMILPIMATGLVIQPGMSLPQPKDTAKDSARAHLATLDLPGAGLGNLARTVVFAAGAQDRPVPSTWSRPQLILIHGDHEGGASAGRSFTQSARIAAATRRGEGALGVLAGLHGVSVRVADAATALALEEGEVCSVDTAEATLRHGWKLAEEAADSGVDVIVIGSCGAGADTAAAAVVSSVTGAEIAGLLARVVSADQRVDDEAWMRRCAAARDGLHKVSGQVLSPRELISELGGPDHGIAAGILLGAAARRIPVLVDGPVGVAAGLIARDLGAQSRHWVLLPDHGGHPTAKTGADVLGWTPLLDLRLDLGEGTSALASLPLLRSALTLAATLPVVPPPQTPDVEPDPATDLPAPGTAAAADADTGTAGPAGAA